jgi:hypothetical protein
MTPTIRWAEKLSSPVVDSSAKRRGHPETTYESNFSTFYPLIYLQLRLNWIILLPQRQMLSAFFLLQKVL